MPATEDTMSGPDHYQEAEEIITQVLTGNYNTSKYSDTELLAMAQVHATLAAAAAAALGTANAEMLAWMEAAGVRASG
jgi:hypothetical protein